MSRTHTSCHILSLIIINLITSNLLVSSDTLDELLRARENVCEQDDYLKSIKQSKCSSQDISNYEDYYCSCSLNCYLFNDCCIDAPNRNLSKVNGEIIKFDSGYGCHKLHNNDGYIQA